MDYRKKAILFLNSLIRDKVREYESLCKKYPQFSIERELPEGGITKGGILADLEVWRYALRPNPEKTASLVDELLPQTIASLGPEVNSGTDCQITITEVVQIEGMAE